MNLHDITQIFFANQIPMEIPIKSVYCINYVNSFLLIPFKKHRTPTGPSKASQLMEEEGVSRASEPGMPWECALVSNTCVFWSWIQTKMLTIS